MQRSSVKKMTSQEKINQLRSEIEYLRQNLKVKEAELQELEQAVLSKEEIVRYSRQIIIPEIRVKGQTKLKTSSVLIVGAGGLGCPAAIYLAAAGVGHIGLIDYDQIDETNLHRQILYTTDDVGQRKVKAAARLLKRSNNHVKVTEYDMELNSKNALPVVGQFDVIVDATDNLATRYLLNDACVIQGRPLVSGSALQFEGQLTVFNYDGGPCYRCLYPQPPPPETVASCGDVGVIGAVPGVIGVLQALETIKIIVGLSDILSSRMLVFDGTSSVFRNIKLRGKNKSCEVCGASPTITELIDYEQFCGSPANDKVRHLNLLEKDERISPAELKNWQQNNVPHVVVDVRSDNEFEMCSIPDAVNIPLAEMDKNENLEQLKDIIQNKREKSCDVVNVCVVCRRGNDSQLGVRQLKKLLDDISLVSIQDLRGGLHGWAFGVDPSFPVY